MEPDPSSPCQSDAAAALLKKAIAVLRAAGKIVQRQSEVIGGYTVDASPPLTTGQVVALAWDTGLMSGSQGCGDDGG